MSLFKQNGSASTQVLIIDGETESQGRNAKEHLPHLSLNAPVFLGEYHSQAGEFGAGLSQVKAIENGNYLQRSFSLESSRVTPRSERISCSSTVTAGGQYTPFPGFQIPNETVIPKEYSARKGNTGISAQEAIPVLPRSVAIICLILNILIPGSGTVISGLIAFFLTRRDLPLMSRTSILCVNCFVGVMQLSTIVFLMIGWIWSIAWGCAFVGLSERYGKDGEKVDGGEQVA
ncbi:hypothetical protein OS493_005533 [Desmophyllum pertusum]|uniref:Protein SPEC3 n=1 Tax=Desmophyllum pertusum TaxID=174260 RepID=A0A9X0CMJ6_9CNID|nr:hypothetical protein OS493_005533 [Desmophyllum pertusum]